jgi:transposase
VEQISRIGMDTSKHLFQLHGVDVAEKPVLRRTLRRRDMITFFERLTPTRVAIEACGASHHWARLLRGFGHEVQLIAPQLVKPYVKRGKNDAADAEALCEAMSRPTMRFVPVKTAEQQAALMLVKLRDRLIRNRTQLVNAIRGYAAEFGIAGAKGIAHVTTLLARLQADVTLPALARELFAMQAGEYAQVQAKIAVVEAKLLTWHRPDRGDDADHEDAGARGLSVGSSVRRLDRLDAQGSLDGRQGEARRDHPSGGRRSAQRARGRRHGSDQARARGPLPRRRQVRSLGRQASRAQAAEARGSGVGQQARPRRLEADDHGRSLRREASVYGRSKRLIGIGPGTEHGRPASVPG